MQSYPGLSASAISGNGTTTRLSCFRNGKGVSTHKFASSADTIKTNPGEETLLSRTYRNYPHKIPSHLSCSSLGQ